MRKWLYHPSEPARIFNVETDAQLQELYDAGWCETDAHFTDAHEPASDYTPGDTGAESDAEPPLQHMFRVLYQRGYREFVEQLQAAQEALTKDDLKALADELDVYVMKAWKPQTMVNKIVEAVNGGDG